jgi:hypothetical protein
VTIVYGKQRSRSEKKKYKCGYMNDLLTDTVLSIKCHEAMLMKDGIGKEGLVAYVKVLVW